MPIQMRTNELLSGVRSTSPPVIYGRDTGELRGAGERVAGALRKVPGAADVARAPDQRPRIPFAIRPIARSSPATPFIADVNELTEDDERGAPSGVVLEGERGSTWW